MASDSNVSRLHNRTPFRAFACRSQMHGQNVLDGQSSCLKQIAIANQQSTAIIYSCSNSPFYGAPLCDVACSLFMLSAGAACWLSKVTFIMQQQHPKTLTFWARIRTRLPSHRQPPNTKTLCHLPLPLPWRVRARQRSTGRYEE